MSFNKIKMTIKSKNFRFLEEKLPELACLADFAEEYVYSDPASSLVKLRSFVEKSIHIIYAELGLRESEYANLNELMNDPQFTQMISPELLTKLHAIRMNGNKAAHSHQVSTESAKWLLKEAYDISKWMHLSLMVESLLK